MSPITAEHKKRLKHSAAVRKGKRDKAIELDAAIARAIEKDPY